MPARTVLHGMDQSCPSYAKLPSNGNEAAQCHQEDLDCNWEYVNGIWTPKGVMTGRFDFAVLGGAVGDIDTGIVIPAGYIITHAWIHVITAVTSSGSATVAVKVENSADIMAATAKASMGAGVFVIGAPIGTVATLVQATVNRNLKVTVGTAALTAGKFDIHLQGFKGQLT